MKPKEIFSLAVRLLGLMFLYQSLSEVPNVLPGMFGNRGMFVLGVFVIVWPLVVAFWLFRGAPLIMRIAFRDTPSSAGPS